MKKKLLFVIPSLALGGAEKSFVNLLNALDFEKYDADVFLFVKSGEFLPLLPKQVKILPISEDFATFSLPFLKSVFTFCKKGRLDLALYRLLFVLGNTRARNASVSEQITWKYLKNFFPKIQGNYDAAIGYLEKSSNYFITDCVSASQKIGWIHTDLKALDLDFAFEEKYLKKLDKIITVSENLVDKLQTYFPEIKEKFYCIENINSAKIINELANQPQEAILEDDEVFNIIFVGRLVKEKALHIAIEALELLLKKNINARLYLVGEGNKRPELQKMVQEKNIEEKVEFLGVQSNPYPLVKAADLFLMTSVFEGKSIALEEAKILKKPIVITNFSTASEQITDGKTGLIAEMNVGNVGIGSNSDVTFTIENSGLENLTLGAATISGAGYTLLSTYTSPVSANASTTFVIRFSPTSAATFTGSISIPNNDTTGTENPYIINFTGVGTCNIVDFESASKTSYATDDVVINGKIWQLSEALIGDLTNDYKVGLKSLRIRDDINAKAEMQEDFTAGVSTISFNYRLYTSDTMSAIFKLEISKDAGNSWSQVGGSIVPTSTVQTFNETINQAGPVRFRIVYSGGATTSSLRFNIDNISVCSYDTPQEIEVTGNNTTIPDGSTTILNKNNTNFGSDYFVGDGTIVKSFTVRNLGTGTLTLSNPTISGSTDFTVSTLSNTSLISGDSATFTVSFSSTTVGNKTATVSIINNDANENPYTFNVGASVFNYTRCALSSYTVIAQQDFEDSPASPALSYTSTGTTARTGGTGYGDNRTTQTNMFIGTKSFQVTSNNTAEIIFSNVDTSQYQNVNLNFRLGAYGTTTTDGIETGDEVLLSLSTDGGTTWSKQIKIKGSNNSVFDINTASGTPVSLVYDQTSTSEATFGTGFNSTNTFSNSFTITDLPSVPSLRFKINFSFSTSAANTEKIALDNFRLEGQLPLTKTYQNGAWLTGAPSINEKAIIDDNFITGGANGNITACECQINSGRTLTIAANTSATIESDIINNGNIVVESDGNLLQKNDYASFSGNNILVRRNANLKRLDYNYWGAPVTGQNLRTFSTGTLPSRFYTYNEATDGFVTIDPYNNTFSPAKGYAIRASNTATTTPQVFAGEFRGIPNNGVVAINLAFTDAAHGYNLVANPYPSNIDLDQLYADNSSDITGEFYFWTNINPNPAMQFSNYPQLGFYNNYAVYNASGGVPAASPATCVQGCVADSPTPTNIVKPGQGFIVRATGAARTLDFNNALRRTNPGNFFNRTSNQVKSNDRYWVQLMTPLKLVNTILIAYKEGSTKDFEENFDAKLLVQSPDSFYSTVDNNKLLIQGRGYPFTTNDKVNIGASFYQAGVHTISLAKKEGEFSAEQPIYLHDKKLETIVDLQKQEYSFTAEPGETKDRFEIIYNINNRNLATQENNKYGVLVYEAENHFIVQADKAFDQLKMYDLSGKLLKTIEARKKYLMIEKSQLNKGVIVFSIIFADEMVNKKIISN